MTTTQATTVVLIGGPRCGEVHELYLTRTSGDRFKFADPFARERAQVGGEPIHGHEIATVEYELMDELHPTMHYRVWSVTREGHIRAQFVKPEQAEQQ